MVALDSHSNLYNNAERPILDSPRDVIPYPEYPFEDYSLLYRNNDTALHTQATARKSGLLHGVLVDADY